MSDIHAIRSGLISVTPAPDGHDAPPRAGRAARLGAASIEPVRARAVTAGHLAGRRARGIKPASFRPGRGSAWLERLVRDQEVGGSNPLAPTTLDSITHRRFKRASKEALESSVPHPSGMRSCCRKEEAVALSRVRPAQSWVAPLEAWAALIASNWSSVGKRLHQVPWRREAGVLHQRGAVEGGDRPVHVGDRPVLLRLIVVEEDHPLGPGQQRDDALRPHRPRAVLVLLLVVGAVVPGDVDVSAVLLVELLDEGSLVVGRPS